MTRGDLFPAYHGAAVKIERTAWAESFAARMVLLVTDDPGRYWVYRSGRRTRHRYPRALRTTSRDGDALLRAAGIPPGEAFLYRALLDDGLVRRLDWIARRYRVELFQAEFPAFARPCLEVGRRRGGRVLLVEHNVEFERIAAQHPGLPRRTRHWLREIEVSLANQSDAVVVLTQRDRETLERAGVTTRIEVIPPGVDGASFERARRIDLRARYGLPRGQPVLVFHGVYRYPPNLEAVETLAREILPRLRVLGLRASVLAIGLDPPSRRLHRGVCFAGPVRSLAAHLKSADLAVAPLRQGAGVRLKLLEYFAAGLPVVATPEAAAGLPIRNGVEALLVRGSARFAAAVARLLRDSERGARLAAGGRRLAAGYDWREAGRLHLRAAGLLTPPRGGGAASRRPPTSPRTARGSRGTRARTRRRPGA